VERKGRGERERGKGRGKAKRGKGRGARVGRKGEKDAKKLVQRGSGEG
jgi:hypothetical protein